MKPVYYLHFLSSVLALVIHSPGATQHIPPGVDEEYPGPVEVQLGGDHADDFLRDFLLGSPGQIVAAVVQRQQIGIDLVYLRG